jgi:hypothetical protein
MRTSSTSQVCTSIHQNEQISRTNFAEKAVSKQQRQKNNALAWKMTMNRSIDWERKEMEIFEPKCDRSTLQRNRINTQHSPPSNINVRTHFHTLAYVSMFLPDRTLTELTFRVGTPASATDLKSPFYSKLNLHQRPNCIYRCVNAVDY